jgi:hypothetical protein
VRSVIRDLGLIGLAYLLVWGVSWLTGDRSSAVFGVTDNGSSYSYYPGVLFGGLPPTPWRVSDAPQLVAAIVGGVGLVALVIRRPWSS